MLKAPTLSDGAIKKGATVASMGERGAIELLTRRFGKTTHRRLPLGYDDDVGAIPDSNRSWLVVKCDMLVASTDVPPGMTDFEIGRKAVVSTVSDFAAKGVRPRGLIVALGLPRDTSKKQLSSLGNGLASASREYGCPIVGGDTNESHELVIDVSGFGRARPNQIIRRDGARPGDIVAVTGKFGDAAAGLHLMLSEKKPNRTYGELVRAVTRPRARLEEGIRLENSKLATSSIDSSDGLAWSLHELARLSHVGFRLHRIPVSNEAAAYARRNNLRALDFGLYGGEEYEIVLTLRNGSFQRAKRIVPSLIQIGTVVDGGSVIASVDGEMMVVDRRGWEHFRKE